MTPQEKAKDKRLQKCYGWTLGMYYDLLKLQNGRCAICGRLPKDKPLNVDHYHFRVIAERMKDSCVGKWVASVLELGVIEYGQTKIEAVEKATKFALPLSVRGLLCPGRHRGCNRLLGRVDDSVWLWKALAYIENPPARAIINRK
jgi:hypothetical protein